MKAAFFTFRLVFVFAPLVKYLLYNTVFENYFKKSHLYTTFIFQWNIFEISRQNSMLEHTF